MLAVMNAPLLVPLLLAVYAAAAPRYEVRPFDRSQLPRGVRVAVEKKRAEAMKPGPGKLLQHPLTKTRAYVKELVRSIAAASNLQTQTADVLTAVDGGSGLTSGMNLGGILTIASQLVRRARAEDEIAAVIAHELVHHTHAHPERVYGSRFTFFGNERAPAGGDGGDAYFTSGATGGPSAEEKKQLLGFEVEADIIGLRVLVNAGYDPEAAVTVLHAYDELLQKEPRLGAVDGGGLHPPRAARTAGLRTAMSQDGMTASARRPVPPEVVAELADALKYDLQRTLDYCQKRGETSEITAWGTVTPCIPAKK